jgi:flagellar hook-basal body complex protein FliE
MAIDGIQRGLTPAISRAGKIDPSTKSADGAKAAGGSSFGDSLAGLLASVDESAGAANDAVADMISGSGDVHEAMIALQRAETTLQLTVQVRNKLVQAYQDVMRMPI